MEINFASEQNAAKILKQFKIIDADYRELLKRQKTVENHLGTTNGRIDNLSDMIQKLIEQNNELRNIIRSYEDDNDI